MIRPKSVFILKISWIWLNEEQFVAHGSSRPKKSLAGQSRLSDCFKKRCAATQAAVIQSRTMTMTMTVTVSFGSSHNPIYGNSVGLKVAAPSSNSDFFTLTLCSASAAECRYCSYWHGGWCQARQPFSLEFRSPERSPQQQRFAQFHPLSLSLAILQQSPKRSQ